MNNLYGKTGTSFVAVTLTASGQEIVAAVAGKRIRVFAYLLSNLLATNVKFQSAISDISLTHYFPATGGIVVPAIDMAWMVTAPGEALNINMSVNTSVGVQVTYDIVE